MLGGFWSTYWYNGQIYGSEIARGFDTFGLMPSEHLTAAEIAAARQVQVAQFNAQHQQRFTWDLAEPRGRAGALRPAGPHLHHDDHRQPQRRR